MMILISMTFSLYGCDDDDRIGPKTEFCLNGITSAVCTDPRINKGKPYSRPMKDIVNYIATNPDDYETWKIWIIDNCSY